MYLKKYISLIFIILHIACSSPEKDPNPSNLAQHDWRWDNLNDFGRSLNPNREHVIEVTLGTYRPGDQPFGVGERLRAFRLVADKYEKINPTVTIEFRLQVTIARGAEGEAVRTQLLGGVAPEIIQMNTEAMWPDIEQKKGWWVPLDKYLDQPNPYVKGNQTWISLFANQALTQAKRAPDGQLYCITLDMVETGIFYNKTLFKKYGARIPETWQEFLQLQKSFADSGLIPMVTDAAVLADWSPDLIFDQCYFELLPLLDYKKKSALEETYYQGYLTPEELCWLIKKRWFTATNPRFRETWRILKEWRRYWQKDLTHID